MLANRYLVKMIDKNLGVAVMLIVWYENQCADLLSDDKMYILVNNIPTRHLQSELTAIIVTIKNKVVNKILTNSQSEILVFYGIPKVHKNLWKLYPIVLCHSWITTKAAKILDAHLVSHVNRYSWVINSTQDFITAIEELPDNILSTNNISLVSADGKGFYMNVDIDTMARCIEAILRGLLKHNQDEFLMMNEAVIILKYLNKNNYLVTNDGYQYHQKSGLAMGGPASGTIANLYLAFEEKAMFWNASPQMLFYRRYVNDIFMIFHASKPEVNRILAGISYGPLKLSLEVCNFKIMFLDTTMTKAAQLWNRLVTSLHQKARNTHSYVPWSSAHPGSMKTAWVEADMICRKMIYFNELVYNEALMVFIKQLVGGGYPRHVLAMLERDVTKHTHSSLLYPSGQDSSSAPLIIPAYYDNILYNVSTRQLERLLQPTVNDMQ